MKPVYAFVLSLMALALGTVLIYASVFLVMGCAVYIIARYHLFPRNRTKEISPP